MTASVRAIDRDGALFRPRSEALEDRTVFSFTPAQLRAAYGFDAIVYADGYQGLGAGQVIAITIWKDHPNIENDLHEFDRQFNLPDPSLATVVLGDTETAPRGDGTGFEVAMDVEWAHAMAPLASILLVEADNPFDAVKYARQQPNVTVVSMSWGQPEFDGETDYDSYFTTPAGHTGVTFVAASGDNGAPPIYPAASPNVVAVGGTVLTLNAQGHYGGETGWSNPPGGPTGQNGGGSGGGLSVYESQPSYQLGLVAQSTTRRATPDISLVGASSVQVYDSYDSGADPWIEETGTSLSAPLLAGLIADADDGLIAQGRNTLQDREALADLYTLYLKGNGHGSPAFNDVTSGYNGFSAGPGYDLVTGVGTPKAAVVAAALSQDCAEPTPVSPNSILQPVDTTTPTFQWTAPAGAANYRLRVYGPSGTAVIDILTSNTSFTPAPGTLTRGASYSWTVQAISYLGARGDLGTSEPAFFAVRSATPTPGNPFAGQAVATTRPTFTWSAVAGATSYGVTVVDARSHQTVAAASGLTDTSWTPSAALTNGGGYQWQVQAYTVENGTAIANPPSGPVSFFVNVTGTLALTTPAAGATVTTATPHLEWTPMPANYDSYTLSVYDVTAGVPVIGNLGINGFYGHSYDFTVPLSSGHTFQWTVYCGPYYDIVQNGVPTVVDQRVFATARFTVAVPGATTHLPAPTPTGLTTWIPMLATATPTFQWAAVPGATGYGLYIFTPGTPATSWTAPVVVPGTSYTPSTPLDEGRTYFWWVTAFDAAGNVSPPSQATDFGVWLLPSLAPDYQPTANPDTPTGQIATSTPTFQWSANTTSNHIQNYYFALFDETAHSVVLAKAFRGSVTSYTPSADGGPSLLNNHTYRWYVSALGTEQGPAVDQTFVVSLLNAPHVLTQTSQPTTPTLRWSGVDGATGYVLSLTDTTTHSTILDAVAVTDTSYTPTAPLDAADAYEWQVTATDGDGNTSPPSDPATLTVAADFAAPALAGPDDTVTTLTPILQWSAVVGTAGYDMYLVDTTTGTRVLDGLSTTAAQYTAPPLTNGHRYQWWAVAVDGAGNVGPAPTPLAFGVDIPVSAAGVPTPWAPAGSVAVSPTLRWDAAAGAAGYVVDIMDVTSGQPVFVLPPVSVSDTSYIPDTPLVTGHVYEWQVHAVDAEGVAGDWSQSLRFTVSKGSGPPAAPAPTVVGVSPGSDLVFGGRVVTIIGTGFTGASSVTFGSAPAAVFTVDSDTAITATVPPGAVGTVGVQVTTPGGSAFGQFTYILPAPPQTPPPAPTPNLVGYPQFAAGGDAGEPPTATVFNPDRSVAAILTPFPGTTGGVRVAEADFNGDGVTDLAAGTGPGAASEVKVIDGKTGAVLFDLQPFAGFTGGVFVAAGDVTGDGAADLVITPDLSGGPRVSVFRGGDFAKVADFFGIDDPNFRGGARAALGDLTGDGRADLAISAGFGGGPRISLFDGAALAAGQPAHLTSDFFAFEPGLRNGAYVAIGDVDGDGQGDLIFGAGPGGGPRVLVVSGRAALAGGPGAALASPVANFFGGDPGNRGGIRVAVKNLDGDAQADVATGSGTGGGSGVAAYLGKDLATGASPEDLGFDAFPGLTGGVFVG